MNLPKIPDNFEDFKKCVVASENPMPIHFKPLILTEGQIMMPIPDYKKIADALQKMRRPPIMLKSWPFSLFTIRNK